MITYQKYSYQTSTRVSLCLCFSQVIDVKSSFVNMVPSKVEVSMRKADAVAWGKLEDPKHKPEPELTDNMNSTEQEEVKPQWDISDDDISESDWEDEEEEKKEERQKEDAEDGPPELEEPADVKQEK